MTFHSNAEEIRHYLKQLLEDGQPHSRTELFNYVNSNSSNGCSFTVGMLSSALKTLTDNSDIYTCIQRGVYQKTGETPPAASGASAIPAGSAAPAAAIVPASIAPAAPIASAAPSASAASSGAWEAKMDDLAQILTNAKDEINALFTFNYLDMPVFTPQEMASLQKVKAFVSSIDTLIRELS